MTRNISLIINKSEITAGTRGASLGPEALMTAARKEESDFFSRFPMSEIDNCNSLLDSGIEFKNAKRIKGLIKVFENISNEVHSKLIEGSFPLVLAADHGSAGGTIAGIKKMYPGKRLGVVWIDAHADLHTPYTTPSGNMHGRPLATALNEDNIECQRNIPNDSVLELWGELKQCGDIAPKINAEDLIFVGVRDAEQEEEAIMERMSIKNFTVEEVRESGAGSIVNQIEDRLSKCDIIYVSFDVDSMDPDMTSYGTGTPVKNGITPLEAEGLLVGMASNPKLKCLEFVEVNPCLDEKINRMAEITFDLVEKTTKAL
jgi:arginase